jgi:serine/threonine-protein kinase
MTDEPNPHIDDQMAFDALNDYVERLHAGERPARTKPAAGHPDLADLFDCLDSLDGIAPEVAPCAPPTVDLFGESPDAAPAIESADLPRPFGKYVLLEEAGRGGMGVVFRAHQPELDRVVAVKMILSSHLASREQVHRFYSEARAAARLQNANIVRIHEVGQVNGQHYFAMEYVSGPTLSQLVARTVPAAEESARIVSAVARAVHYLHTQGIVHRDLKPSNILLDENGQPTLTDFGLAKLLVDESLSTSSGTIAGTPSYMAPEQAAGRTAEIGPISDVYSLGAILYELLTGRPPFKEEHPLDTLVQVLEGEPTLIRQINPRVPGELEQICLRCLEKSPDRRYRSAAALADDLDRFLRGEVIEAGPLGTWPRLRRWARRKPALSSRLAALAVYFAIEQLWYHGFGIVTLEHHVLVSAFLVLWALASLGCQWLIDRGKADHMADYYWASADVLFLTLILLVANGVKSPLIIGYPLLIVASGLWYRVRFVVYMTALSLFSYFLLMLDAVFLRPHVNVPFDYHAIFIIALIVMGSVVAYQVNRVRLLNRYFERRPVL